MGERRGEERFKEKKENEKKRKETYRNCCCEKNEMVPGTIWVKKMEKVILNKSMTLGATKLKELKEVIK